MRAILALLAFTATLAAAPKTKNVILVMTDGLRWQEVFEGVDPALLNKESGVSDVAEMKRLYWRETAVARRGSLMPFFWNTIAKRGQIFGNRREGSEAWVTNGLNFSYPGYSEILCGLADPRVKSNDKIPNPNVTVLEWLNNKPAYKGKVAAFGAWDVISYIVNKDRSGIHANSGYEPWTLPPVSERMQLLNRLKRETRLWGGEPFDSFVYHTAMEYIKVHKPRVLLLSLGETDEWAHGGKYQHYIDSTRQIDGWLSELWETVQSMPEYRDNTTLIFATDHGRGDAPLDWKSHGQKLPDSKYVWFAFLGPDTPALGERKNVGPVTQNRIAATLAAFLGEDYAAAVPSAGKPIADVLPQ